MIWVGVEIVGEAGGDGLDRGGDRAPRVDLPEGVEARRPDELGERAAGLERPGDRAAADGQAAEARRISRREEERRGGSNVRTDDVRRSQVPLVDQSAQELAHRVRRDQLRATLRVPEAGQVDGDHAPDRGEAAPDATEGPERLRPRRRQQHGGVRARPRVRVPHAHPVADAEVSGDRRSGLGRHRHRSLPLACACLRTDRINLPDRTGKSNPEPGPAGRSARWDGHSPLRRFTR